MTVSPPALVLMAARSSVMVVPLTTVTRGLPLKYPGVRLRRRPTTMPVALATVIWLLVFVTAVAVVLIWLAVN